MFFSKKYKNKLEYEFMPDLIGITENPGSPMGSVVVWLVFMLMAITITWSIVSKVDTVAVTDGKIIPKGKLNIITTADSGVIKKIYLKEGEKVKKGDFLIEFNSIISQTEINDTIKQIERSSIENEILESELKGLSKKDKINIKIPEVKYLSKEDTKKYFDLKEEREEEYVNKLEKENLLTTQKEIEKSINIIEHKNMIRKKNILRIEADNTEQSYESGLISKLEYLKKQDELATLKENIKSQKYKITMIEKNIEESHKNIILIKKERKSWILSQLINNKKELDELNLRLRKEQQSNDFQKIYSPVNGTVNKININNSGGFVESGTEIMTIVPEKTELEAEVYIQNKDIGFVREGQKVEVKLDTFPFQDYGMLEGIVRIISPDAIKEENKSNLVYKTYVKLITKSLIVNGKEKEIKPGMTLKAEIKTDKRRIIDFFLSPIKKSLNESINLR